MTKETTSEWGAEGEPTFIYNIYLLHTGCLTDCCIMIYWYLLLSIKTYRHYLITASTNSDNLQNAMLLLMYSVYQIENWNQLQL